MIAYVGIKVPTKGSPASNVNKIFVKKEDGLYYNKKGLDYIKIGLNIKTSFTEEQIQSDVAKGFLRLATDEELKSINQ